MSAESEKWQSGFEAQASQILAAEMASREAQQTLHEYKKRFKRKLQVVEEERRAARERMEAANRALEGVSEEVQARQRAQVEVDAVGTELQDVRVSEKGRE